MCRKLETEQEKVLPFYSSTLTEEEEEQVKSAEQEEPAEVLAKVRCTWGGKDILRLSILSFNFFTESLTQ